MPKFFFKKSLIKGTLILVGLLWWVAHQAALSLSLPNGHETEKSVKISWVELRTGGSLTSCYHGKTDFIWENQFAINFNQLGQWVMKKTKHIFPSYPSSSTDHGIWKVVSLTFSLSSHIHTNPAFLPFYKCIFTDALAVSLMGSALTSGSSVTFHRFFCLLIL